MSGAARDGREVSPHDGGSAEVSVGPSTSGGVTDVVRALLPRHQDVLELRGGGVPRWFVPLDGPRARYNGLALYPAVRWRSRAYRAALRLWLVAGDGRHAHRLARVIPRDGGGWALGEKLLPYMPTLATAAVYVGTPGPEQKVTVQLMDVDGRVLGFAKYAASPRTRRLIANEARMLRTIPENTGPSLIRFMDFLEGELLVQTPLPGRILAPKLRPSRAQMRLLEHLVRPGQEVYTAPEHPFVESLRERAGGYGDMLEGVVADLKGGAWPIALSHGDLSPWNMRRHRGACLAFDWEHGRQEGMAYLEAAHAPIQVASLLRNEDPRWAKRVISRRLRPRLPQQLGGFAPAIASLSALSMLISWYPPRPPDAFERWLTAFVKTPL